MGDEWDPRQQCTVPVVKRVQQTVALPLGPVDPTMIIQGPDASDDDLSRVHDIADMPIHADEIRALTATSAFIVTHRHAFVMEVP